MMPAMAYSIGFLLKPLCGLRKAPEQNEERDYDRDVEQIQHDHLWLHHKHARACLLSMRIVGRSG